MNKDCNNPSDMKPNCSGLNGTVVNYFFGYKGFNSEMNKTITYLFTPNLKNYKKFFKYMDANFKGQHYYLKGKAYETVTIDKFHNMGEPEERSCLGEPFGCFKPRYKGHEREGKF